MNQGLDREASIALAKHIKSKAQKPFDNAYRAVLATQGATYVQGFVAFATLAGRLYRPVEHAWIELDEKILDPNLPFLDSSARELYYFPAQRLSVKTLKAAIEEAQEDYPEDEPLPIYGAPPYEYYGDVMLGGKDYLNAYEAAEAKCKELS